MIALCAEIARNHAIDLARKADCRKRDLLARCDRDEYCPPQFGTKQRDPVDAGRQLEVLAQLFREGRMPDGGVEILEGIASGRSYEELAMGLGITDENARWRMRRMRTVFRARMAKLGMLPGVLPLQVVAALPGAVTTLRQAA
jgi:DNA-directed RNA polymerase specialized sigma24 family protein